MIAYPIEVVFPRWKDKPGSLLEKAQFLEE
jgi:hypothetical protein